MDDFDNFIKQANSGGLRKSASTWRDPRDEIFAQDEIRNKLQVQPQQPEQAGGILGFLQGAGKSIGSNFERIGKGTANVIHEMTGGAQQERDLQSKSQQEDIQMIKLLGEKIRGSKSDEEKSRYRDTLARISKSGDERDKSFIDRQNEIVEQNDPTKGAAAVASLGLDVLGAGTGGSILSGGLKQAIARGVGQGAIYGGTQGALDPLKEKGAAATSEDIGGNAFTGAGVGALTGGVLGGAGGLVGKITNRGGKPSSFMQKTLDKTEKAGSDLLGSQANLTRAEARKIGLNPSEVMGSINKRTGLSSMDDMAEVGKNLTGGGEDSLLDTITRAAVGESKGVQIGDLRKAATEAIENGGSVLTDSQRKNLLRNMTQAGVTMRGGSKGSLSNLADPGKALDQANIFRSTARDLTKGLNVSAEQRQQAKIYNDVASQIEKAIYDSPGVNDSLPMLKKAGVDDMLFKAREAADAGNKAQATAYKKLADELGQVNDIKTLRNMKKDFVGLSKIDEATARAQSGAGAQLGDNMQGLGRFVQKPTNLLAIPLNAMTPKVGSGIAKASRILKGSKVNPDALDVAFNPTPQEKALRGTASGLFGSTAMPVTGEASGALEPEQAPQEDLSQIMSAMPAQYGTEATTPEDTDNIFTKANIQKLILQDMAGNEGKNVNQLLALYKAFGESDNQKLNATTQKALAQSANGMDTINQLEGLLSSAGGGQGNVGGNLANFFGGLGFNNNAKTYNDLSEGSIAQISKAMGETGTLSDTDIALYRAMLPKLTDTNEVAQNKIAALKERLQSTRSNTATFGAGTPDLNELLGGTL